MINRFDIFLSEIGKLLPGSSKVYAIIATISYLISLCLPVMGNTPPFWRGFQVLFMGGLSLFSSFDLFLSYLSNFALMLMIYWSLSNKHAKPSWALLVMLVAIPGMITHKIPRDESGTSEMVDFYVLKFAWFWFCAYVLNFLAHLKSI